MNDRIKRLKDSKVLTVLLSIALACIVWIYVDNEQMPTIKDTIRNVPVTMIGREELEERELMVTYQSTQNIDLHLEGKRYALLDLNNKNIIVTLDVSSIQEEGSYDLLCSVALPSGTASGTATVTERDSYRVKVTVEKRVTKLLEVVGSYTGSLKGGYRGGEFILDPSEIEISGPKSLISTIEKARVVLSENDLKESYSGPLPVELVNTDGQVIDIDQVECETTSVYTVYPIELVKELKLTVEIVAGGGATAEDVSYRIFPETLTVSGRGEDLADLEELSLGKIALAEISGNSIVLCPVELPEGVMSEDAITEAKVTVKFNGLTIKPLEATDFEVINVPEGHTAELLTNSLTVLIRGQEEAVEQVRASQLKVIVDLSGIAPETGEVEVPVKVTITTPQNDDVGVIETNDSVRVDLSR